MKQISERKRAKMTGKGGASTFMGIPHFVLRSPQWALLSGAEVKMLIELAMQYNGHNNGDFSATREHLRARGWKSHQTMDAALRSLEKKGWIVKTRQGGKHAGCTLYGVTWEAVDDCNGKHQWPPERKPSHAWKGKVEGLIFRQRRPDFQAPTDLAA